MAEKASDTKALGQSDPEGIAVFVTSRKIPTKDGKVTSGHPGSS